MSRDGKIDGCVVVVVLMIRFVESGRLRLRLRLGCGLGGCP